MLEPGDEISIRGSKYHYYGLVLHDNPLTIRIKRDCPDGLPVADFMFDKHPTNKELLVAIESNDDFSKVQPWFGAAMYQQEYDEDDEWLDEQ